MELRALLCWASLATALEGEITWGCPPFLGSPKLCFRVQKLASPYSNSGTPKHFGPIVLEREGAGEEAAWPGVGFFFCLGKRWSRELRTGTFPYPVF